MRYCTCQTRGCRHEEDLVLCDLCANLVCDLHSVEIGHGRRCRRCGGSELARDDRGQAPSHKLAPTQAPCHKPQPQQQSLF